MVQWTPNADALFFKAVMRVHDIKVDYKRVEDALREEGVDVTAKALMHRVAKLKATVVDPGEPGKASPLKAAKRAVDGKPKTVVADPEDGAGAGQASDAEVEKPKAKKSRTTKAAAPKTNGAKAPAKGKKAAKKEELVEEEDGDEDMGGVGIIEETV